MDWLNKLKEYAPDIAAAILSGGATLPQLALKAVGDAVGRSVDDVDQLGAVIESANPETMLKIKQAGNAFKIKMAELGSELTATELGDIQHAREQHKHSLMPSLICCFLTLSVVSFGAALMFVVVPEANVRIIDTLFGSFLTAWLSSVAYWIGTTRSSGNKTISMMKGN
jgi:hypothetical protein